jgi:hypothetical protein
LSLFSVAEQSVSGGTLKACDLVLPFYLLSGGFALPVRVSSFLPKRRMTSFQISFFVIWTNAHIGSSLSWAGHGLAIYAGFSTRVVDVLGAYTRLQF